MKFSVAMSAAVAIASARNQLNLHEMGLDHRHSSSSTSSTREVSSWGATDTGVSGRRVVRRSEPVTTSSTTISSWGVTHGLNLIDEQPACYDMDLGITDSGGDNCAWYSESTNFMSCGGFDDDDFVAALLCCACGGGSPTPLDTANKCFDLNNGAKDNGGDDCAWYAESSNYMSCGGYDDADFEANNMCCACGGGSD